MSVDKPPQDRRPERREKIQRAGLRLTDSPNEEAVGYGNPPRPHQFKPGQSGNPKGRPKGRKTEATMLNELLFQKVTVRQSGGRERRMTLFEAMLRRFAEGSLKGNIKAAAFLFNRFSTISSDQTHQTDLSDDDQAVLKAYAHELLSKNNGDGT